MQEIHSIGGPPRFFSGTGGDRRLRPQHHNQQALKCPRCDSLNTKFCYYNNYNLSQPRHFCKNCRRYWTKGGVLRNVPVGGGCRKSKRSSKPSKPPSDAAPPAPDSDHNNNNNNNNNSHSSTDSSTLTGAATDAVSAPPPNSDSNTNSVQELIPNNNSVLETDPVEHGTGDCGGIFSEIGPFTSLITTSSTNEALAFGFDASSFQWHHHNKALNTNIITSSGEHHPRGDELLKLAPETSLLDHTVDLNAMHGKTAGHGGFGSLDYQGLFDLPNTVDHAYWSHTHWSDHDNSSLFHLP